jgi:hypothetical protein
MMAVAIQMVLTIIQMDQHLLMAAQLAWMDY